MKLKIILATLLIASSVEANELSDAIQAVRPGAEWILTGDKYEGLEWLDKKQAKPTKSELEPIMQDIVALRMRRKEYPPMDEQVDALMDGGQKLIDVKAKIQEINKKYPTSVTNLRTRLP